MICHRCWKVVDSEKLVWATLGRCELICPDCERKSIDYAMAEIAGKLAGKGGTK